jgi:predicted MFS family arabinose efflux permease
MVFRMSGSAAAVSLLAVANSLPVFLAIPLAGAVADSANRRRVLLICNYAQAVIVLGCLAVEPGRLWLVFPLCAVMQTLSACFFPTVVAAVPNLVRAADLGSANVLLGATFGTTQAVGAALGGLILHLGGTSANIIIDALTFVISSLLIHPIRGAFSAPRAVVTETSPPGNNDSPRAGTRRRYLRDHPAVLACLMIKCLWGFGAGAIVLLTVLPMQTLKVGSEGVAVLFAARGIGATLGPYLVHRFGPLAIRGRAAACAFAVILMGGGWIGFSTSSSLVVATLWATALFAGAGAANATSTVLLQQLVPDEIRGRIMALDGGWSTLVLTVSTALAGVVSDGWGPRTLGTAWGIAEMVLGAIWLLAYVTRGKIRFDAVDSSTACRPGR